MAKTPLLLLFLFTALLSHAQDTTEVEVDTAAIQKMILEAKNNEVPQLEISDDNQMEEVFDKSSEIIKTSGTTKITWDLHK